MVTTALLQGEQLPLYHRPYSAGMVQVWVRHCCFHCGLCLLGNLNGGQGQSVAFQHPLELVFAPLPADFLVMNCNGEVPEKKVTDERCEQVINLTLSYIILQTKHETETHFW